MQQPKWDQAGNTRPLHYNQEMADRCMNPLETGIGTLPKKRAVDAWLQLPPLRRTPNGSAQCATPQDAVGNDQIIRDEIFSRTIGRSLSQMSTFAKLRPLSHAQASASGSATKAAFECHAASCAATRHAHPCARTGPIRVRRRRACVDGRTPPKRVTYLPARRPCAAPTAC
jgi:hypothetical protein